MPIFLTTAAVNMAVALVCGAVIGSERQVRQRMAGLRTNALVALGASGFVVFSQLVEHDASPSRVAAQVVSGIGFLGAGIIFRDGFNVHGLNTAATLWCSAAVGVLAGLGAWPFAILMMGMVVFVNLGLRPLVKWLKRNTKAGVQVVRAYRVVLACAAEAETKMRVLMLQSFESRGLHLQEISLQVIEGGIEIEATVTGDDNPDLAVEQAVQKMAAQAGVVKVRWMAADDL